MRRYRLDLSQPNDRFTLRRLYEINHYERHLMQASRGRQPITATMIGCWIPLFTADDVTWWTQIRRPLKGDTTQRGDGSRFRNET
jgi:hypothetical protein